MTVRDPFAAPVAGGSLGGWVAGEGPPVLLLHGGPGLSYEYLDGLGDELAHGFRVAAYQQRGLEPSTLDGPFTIAQAIEDAVAVLDALAWPQALVAGHSWGGHLALRLAAVQPGRLLGALAIDPLGIAGDGGMDAFAAEMFARAPKQVRERARELDERVEAGEGTAEEGLEALELMWPSYFADPGDVAPTPAVRMSAEAHAGIMAEVSEGLDEVAAALASGAVPYGVVAGGASPMPWGQAARATVDLSTDAFLSVVPGAGHFIWFEAPGAVRSALERLAGLAGAGD